MPSFHVRAAWIVTWAVRRTRLLLVPFVILNLFLTASTVMLGEHYAIHVVAGIGLAAVSIVISNRLTGADDTRS